MKKYILIGIPDFCLGVFWTLLATFIPWLVQLKTTNPQHLTLMFSIYALVGVLTQLIIGFLSDRTRSKWGKRTPWIITGIVLAGISQIGWILANSYIFLLIISVITMIFINVFQCTYYSLAIESAPAGKTSLTLGSCRVFNCLGGAVMSLIAAHMWKNFSLFTNLGIIASLLVIPTLMIIPFVIREQPSYTLDNVIKNNKLTDSSENQNNLALVILCIVTFIVYIGSTSTIHLANTYFVEIIKFNKEQLGMGLFLMNAGTLLFGLLSYKIMHNFNRYKQTLVSSLIAVSIAFAYVAFIVKSPQQLHAMYLFYFIYGSGNVLTLIALFAILAHVSAPSQLGFNVGWFNVSSALGQVIGVNLFTHFITLDNPNIIFKTCSILFIAGAILTLTINRQRAPQILTDLYLY